MGELNGFIKNEACGTCQRKSACFLHELTPNALKGFDTLKLTSIYPQGAILFMENQEPRGVFVVCEGRVKLTISSREGKVLILRVADRGEILDLASVLSGTPYEVTAEALQTAQVAFIRRDDFLRFMAQNPEVSLAVVRQLGANYHGVCGQLRTVGLSSSVGARLTRLLLEWSGAADNKKTEARIKIPLTHEEMAECIGSTRESVTRTLSELRSRHLIIIKGATLTIPNLAALQNHVAAA